MRAKPNTLFFFTKDIVFKSLKCVNCIACRVSLKAVISLQENAYYSG